MPILEISYRCLLIFYFLFISICTFSFRIFGIFVYKKMNLRWVLWVNVDWEQWTSLVVIWYICGFYLFPHSEHYITTITNYNCLRAFEKKKKTENVYIIYVYPFLDYIQLYICIIYSIEMKFNVSLWVLQVRSSLALCNSVFWHNWV